ncbi:MAG: mandelate racemase [Gammaproteobacteria bacterium]|nr:mandelate racemase [Gammaproteobacteria bacterium]
MPNTITRVHARPVVAPFRITPKAATGELTHAALALIDLETADGITGRAYLFAFSPAMLPAVVATIDALSGLLIGDQLAPLALEQKLRTRLRLIDTPGLVGLALSGLDMAAWDAHSKTLGLPLAQALGSNCQAVQAYNSCGLWIQKVATIADAAEQLIAEGGFKGIKIRLGRTSAADDLAAVRAVKERIGDDIQLMSDFNQSQSVSSALQRIRQLDDEGLYWIEEPIRHNDNAGSAQITEAARTPIQTGENLTGDFELKCAIEAGAADYYMPDVQRIGGVSGWLRASALCHASQLPMSSHLFPEFSVHLLAASPTRHWLEFVDWAAPVLQHPVEVRDGMAQVPQRPGAGIEWDEDAVKHFAA